MNLKIMSIYSIAVLATFAAAQAADPPKKQVELPKMAVTNPPSTAAVKSSGTAAASAGLTKQPAKVNPRDAQIDPSKTRANIKEQTAGLKEKMAHDKEDPTKVNLQAGLVPDGGAADTPGKKRPSPQDYTESKVPRGYRDTFGGNRMPGGVVDQNNIKGGKTGQVSDLAEDAANNTDTTHQTRDVGNNTEAADTARDVNDMLIAVGGNPTGDTKADANELAYAMSVGTDGWNATKDKSSSEREAYWRAEENRQRKGARPDPSKDSIGGTWYPIGTPAMKRQQMAFVQRGISARKGKGNAGGSGDGRTEATTASGSGGGVMIRTGQNDGTAGGSSSRGATINWNEIFAINAQVNPKRN